MGSGDETKDMYPFFTTKSRRLTSYKVCSCFTCVVRVCTVQCSCKFREDQIFVDFVKFLICDNL